MQQPAVTNQTRTLRLQSPGRDSRLSTSCCIPADFYCELDGTQTAATGTMRVVC